MVMDKKVKESFVLDTASAICNYDAHYKDHPKYWCRGYFQDYCNIIAFTPNSTDCVALRDIGNQLIVTVSCLTKEDTGWYWCGIQRDFVRDDMDFTELVVTDNRRALSNNFWSGRAIWLMELGRLTGEDNPFLAAEFNFLLFKRLASLRLHPPTPSPMLVPEEGAGPSLPMG
ncbi:Transmembrane domain-containing protein TMIGD3, partial [Eschrichtius robustus]|nr:Transmembrane domain-containing protein TMIGD3 [Eschrichtius robustus]